MSEVLFFIEKKLIPQIYNLYKQFFHFSKKKILNKRIENYSDCSKKKKIVVNNFNFLF